MTYSDICNLIEAGKTAEEIIAVVKRVEKVNYNRAKQRVDNAFERFGANLSSLDIPESTEDSDVFEMSNSAKTVCADNMSNGDVVFTSTERRNSGTVILEAIVASLNAGMVKEEIILAKYGLNPAEWEVTSFKVSTWDGKRKGGDNTPLYASKIAVKPRSANNIRYEDIVEYFNSKITRAIPQPKIHPQGDKNGYVVEIPVPDMHVGLKAYEDETGNYIDCRTIKKDFETAIDNMLSQIKQFNIPVKEFKLVTLGDLLHVDNAKNTTTNGTLQDVDGPPHMLMTVAIDMMEDAVLKLEQIAPVEYIYVQGNHDRILGWGVAKALSMGFRNHENVKFDISQRPHKYRRIGSTLLGWSHGEMNKKLKSGLLYNLREDQAGIIQRFLHVGHLHSSSVFQSELTGVYVEHLDSLCGSGPWEDRSAFPHTPVRYLNAFLWSEKPIPPHRLIAGVE